MIMLDRFLVTFFISAIFFTSSFTQNKGTVNVNPGGTIQITVQQGDIKIQTWDRNEVSAKAEDGDVNLVKNGNNIKLSVDSYGDDVEVSIPKKFNVEARTTFGDIRIDGDLTGNFSAKTSGGDIRTGAVNGNTDVRTDAGDISIGNVTGNASLKTSGGDVTIGKVAGKLDLVTSGGDVNVESVSEAASIKTSGGNITAGTLNGNSSLNTAGGNIMVKKSNEVSLNTSGGDIILFSGSGNITANTAGGNIRLENIKGSLSVNNASGDIYVEFTPSDGSSNRINTAYGNITLMIAGNSNTKITAHVNSFEWGTDDEEVTAIKSDFKSSEYDKDKKRSTAVYKLNKATGETVLNTDYGEIVIKKLSK